MIKMVRILFLGQKPIGEKCFMQLMELHKKKLYLSAVVSNDNDKNVWWNSNKIFKNCVAMNIPFLSNNHRNTYELSELILKYEINMIISVQHPWIIPEDILGLVNFFAFNLHNAKLPTYKGYNSCNHAILNGERFYSSTIHWMKKEVDMGCAAFTEKFKIDAIETAMSLYEKANSAGKKCFNKLLKKVTNGVSVPKEPIVGEGVFYPRNSLEGLREIKDINNPIEVDRKSRAFYFPPFEPAYWINANRKIYILPATFFRDERSK